METLIARPRQLTKQRRRLALAHGARSAFDLSGLQTLHDQVLRPDAAKRLDPAETIARDMARVLDLFGRSAACARRALAVGIKIEDLEPGCTANGASAEARSLPPGHVGRGHGTAAKSID